MKRILFFLLILFAAEPALAQTMSLDMGEGGGSATSRILQLIALLTVLSLAPSILMMVTSFTRIIVVLSFLRSAMGLQQTPPNSVLISLALFLTFFIMTPTFHAAYDQAIAPLVREEITEEQAFTKVQEPFHQFMMKHVREKDLELFMQMADPEGKKEIKTPEDTPMSTLIPAFMISELRRAFEIGFLVFIPFLVIDMLISSVLMAMGMMMLPPVVISLPFKLIFFVLVDGWHMLSGSLVKGYGTF